MNQQKCAICPATENLVLYKFELYVCPECYKRLCSILMKMALEKSTPTYGGHNCISTGYHHKGDVK